MLRIIVAAAATALMTPVASAQDLPTTQLQDHAQVVRQDALTRKLLNNSRGRTSSSSSDLSPSARATCLNKRRAAANLGAGHPKVRQLYALCARAGY